MARGPGSQTLKVLDWVEVRALPHQTHPAAFMELLCARAARSEQKRALLRTFTHSWKHYVLHSASICHPTGRRVSFSQRQTAGVEVGFVTAQSTFPLLQGPALYSSLSDTRLALCSMMCALLDDVKARGVFKHYSPQRPRSGTWSAPCCRAAVVPKHFTLIPLRADREISGGKAFQDLTVVTVASRCSPTNQ